jgi:hypothetical protein
MIECVVGPDEERSGVLVERVQARLRAMLLFFAAQLSRRVPIDKERE